MGDWKRHKRQDFRPNSHLFIFLFSWLGLHYDRPLNVVYLDIKAAFDSVDRLALWKALRGRGIPDILLNLIIALHDNTSVRVHLGKQLSDPLPTTSGVRQGCVLAPVLFCVAIDWILRHMKSKPWVTVGRDRLTDLVYADDTAFSSTHQLMPLHASPVSQIQHQFLVFRSRGQRPRPRTSVPAFSPTRYSSTGTT